MKATSGTAARDDLIQAALRIAKGAPERRLRHQAEADFI